MLAAVLILLTLAVCAWFWRRRPAARLRRILDDFDHLDVLLQMARSIPAEVSLLRWAGELEEQLSRAAVDLGVLAKVEEHRRRPLALIEGSWPVRLGRCSCGRDLRAEPLHGIIGPAISAVTGDTPRPVGVRFSCPICGPREEGLIHHG